MKAMKLVNKSGTDQKGMFIKVTLGGDYEEKEEAGEVAPSGAPGFEAAPESADA